MRTYQTPVGQHVEWSPGLFKDSFHCTGCATTWYTQKDRSHREAASHASSCRRVPSRARQARDASSTHSSRTR